MSETEIARIIGGRSKWQTLQANLNAWKLDPSQAVSIPDEQREQISRLVNAIGQKMQKRQAMLSKASQALIDAKDVETHRKIISDLQSEVNKTDLEADAGSVTLPEGFSLTPVQ